MTLVLITVLASLVFLPILTYLIVKFGAAAYFREKNKQTKNRP